VKRPGASLGGVAEQAGGVGTNERSEVARGIDDGELVVLLDERLLLSEVDGDDDDGGVNRS
jgi:hypothetical protein